MGQSLECVWRGEGGGRERVSDASALCWGALIPTAFAVAGLLGPVRPVEQSKALAAGICGAVGVVGIKG